MVSSILFLIFNLAIFYVIYLACKEEGQSSPSDGNHSGGRMLQRGQLRGPPVSTRQY